MPAIYFICRTISLCFLTLVSAAFVSGQPPAPLEIFEQVWQTIDEKYYDAEFNGVDWRKVKKKYRRRLADTHGSRELYALLDQMAGELRDAHTRVYSPEQSEARKMRTKTSVGIRIGEIGGAPVVLRVEAGSDAARHGIRPGMKLVSVNGVPIRRLMREARRAVGVSSSERSTRMRVFSMILAGKPGSHLKIKLRRRDGKTDAFALTRRVVSARPQLAAEILPSRIAYLQFDQFDASLESRLEAALEKFKTAPALIIDLRGNGGGDGEIGLNFAGRFFKEKTPVARIITRTGAPPLPGMPMTLETGETGGPPLSVPVALLIDEATASTAELVAALFQEQKRAAVFGTDSCGCVLAILDHKPLRGGGELTLSEFGFVTPSGRKLEGAGVKPDFSVPPALADLQTGRDAALEAAQKYLADKF